MSRDPKGKRQREGLESVAIILTFLLLPKQNIYLYCKTLSKLEKGILGDVRKHRVRVGLNCCWNVTAPILVISSPVRLDPLKLSQERLSPVRPGCMRPGLLRPRPTRPSPERPTTLRPCLALPFKNRLNITKVLQSQVKELSFIWMTQFAMVGSFNLVFP